MAKKEALVCREVRGRMVHRTRPLTHTDERGRTALVGHGCPCLIITTATGRPSDPERWQGSDVIVKVPSKLHGKRVDALFDMITIRGKWKKEKKR